MLYLPSIKTQSSLCFDLKVFTNQEYKLCFKEFDACKLLDSIGSLLLHFLPYLTHCGLYCSTRPRRMFGPSCRDNDCKQSWAAADVSALSHCWNKPTMAYHSTTDQ